MKISEMLSRHRRDFTAMMKCEFCGKTEKLEHGYDDRNYHDRVIPKMECSECKKSTESEGGTPDETPTLYPEGMHV